MITRVEIKNFRSIAEADVTLGPLTVLVGRNGSGKSSFVDAMKFVRDALHVGIENAVIDRNGFGSIRRWAPRRPRQVEIALTMQEDFFSGRYELVLGSNGAGFKVTREKAGFRVKNYKLVPNSKQGDRLEEDGFTEDSFERRGGKWITRPDSANAHAHVIRWGLVEERSSEAGTLALSALGFVSGFASIRRALAGNYYTIFPNTLRLPQKPMTERVLSDHGDNFVSVLQHITRNAAGKDEIVQVLQRVVEGVCDVRVQPAGSFLVAELQHQDLETDSENAPWFDLSQESDGTLRMLGLLAALYQEPRTHERSLLALEEPEIALHPGALTILAEELRAASRRRQILVTTQSPDLIASFPADDLRVVERKGGVTHVSPLDETQRQIINDQLFNAGDLLRIEGLRGAGRPGK